MDVGCNNIGQGRLTYTQEYNSGLQPRCHGTVLYSCPSVRKKEEAFCPLPMRKWRMKRLTNRKGSCFQIVPSRTSMAHLMMAGWADKCQQKLADFNMYPSSHNHGVLRSNLNVQWRYNWFCGASSAINRSTSVRCTSTGCYLVTPSLY